MLWIAAQVPRPELCWESQSNQTNHPRAGDIPAVHVVGNHDLAFVSKDYWLTKLKTPPTGWV